MQRWCIAIFFFVFFFLSVFFAAAAAGGAGEDEDDGRSMRVVVLRSRSLREVFLLLLTRLDFLLPKGEVRGLYVVFVSTMKL